MAKGKLGKIVTSGSGQQVAYTAPVNATSVVVTVDLENTSTTPSDDADVKVYFSDSNTGAAGDRVARAIVPANGGHFELSCKLMSAGERIVIESDKANVSVRITGVEEIPA